MTYVGLSMMSNKKFDQKKKKRKALFFLLTVRKMDTDKASRKQTTVNKKK